MFNLMVENRDRFVEKCQERLESDNALVRYKAKQFIGIMAVAETIDEFDLDLYFALVEKMVKYRDCRLIIRVESPSSGFLKNANNLSRLR